MFRREQLVIEEFQNSPTISPALYKQYHDLNPELAREVVESLRKEGDSRRKINEETALAEVRATDSATRERGWGQLAAFILGLVWLGLIGFAVWKEQQTSAVGIVGVGAYIISFMKKEKDKGAAATPPPSPAPTPPPRP